MRYLIAAVALALTVPASAQNLSDVFSSLSAQVAASRQAMSAARPPSMILYGNQPAPQAPPAPDFDLKAPNGQAYGLNDFYGHVIVLEFWANWSGPTKSGAPDRTALARRWADNNVVMLDIGVGATSADVAGFTAAAAPAPNETILLDADQSIFAAYGGSSLPLAAVIDKSGGVFAVIPGADPAKVDAAIRSAVGR